MNSSTNEVLQIQNIHLQAFGEHEGPVISNMVNEMLSQPESISITVQRDGAEVGNIIFTPFKLNNHPDKKCFLLAPLGVLPAFQRQGIGKELIEKGIAHLKSMGVDAVFVLGHPAYYGARGFGVTEVLSPHHELMKHTEAWKMLEIQPGSMAGVSGTSVAVNSIMDPMFWDASSREQM